MKNYIGTVVHFDKTSFERDLKMWQTRMFPAIIEVSLCYNQLKIGKFTQSVFDDLVEGRFSEISDRYKYTIKKDTKQGVGKAIATLIDVDSLSEKHLSDLKEAVEKLADAKFKIETSVFSNAIQLFYEDCVIENGRPQLKREQIEARHQVVIDTDLKNEVYNRLLDAQESLKKLSNYINSRLQRGGQPYFILPESEGKSPDFFLYENDPGQLMINAALIGTL